MIRHLVDIVGIDIAGFVVEAISKQSLDSYFTSNIFSPLGLSISYKHPETYPVPLRIRKGDKMELFKYPVKHDYNEGGGGLFGSPFEYLALLESLLAASRGEKSIISKSSFDKYVAKNWLPDGLHASTLPRAMPIIAGNPFLPGEEWGHSLVFAVSTSLNHLIKRG